MRPFEYCEPVTVEEAVGLLVASPRSRALAGGTDLLVALKRRAVEVARVVNLKRIDAMRRIEDRKGVTILGALATLEDLARSDLVARRHPILVEAVLLMASPQVRRLATVGGNLCNASPAADLAPPLLCLDAAVRIAGPRGARDVPLRSFFRGPGTSVLGPAEIVVEVLVSAAGGRGTYLKFSPRRAMDLAVASVACWRSDDDVRMALGAVAPTPIVCPPTPDGAVAACSPIDDLRASAEYRRHLVRVLSRRALERVGA